jgi:hypothetical protein
MGNQYLKYHEANFTNKIIKESSTNLVPMKCEKENNFIDMDFVPQKTFSVVISDKNNIFIF